MSAGPSMTESVPDPIRVFVEATNAGDSDAFVAAFTSDAYLNDWGREFHGHEGVRAWDRTDNIGVETHFDLVDLERSDRADRWIVTLKVSGNGYNGTGPVTFELRNELIASLRIGP